MGPDLKGVHERRDADWLKRMIQTPTAMLASDPVARKLLADFKNTKMPDLGLNDAQVQSLIDVITACSAVKCDLAGKLKPVNLATAAAIALGRGLFMGSVAQKNGGPACISCHTMQGAGGLTGGGTLSKDLTNAFARLGDSDLDLALRSPGFRLMNKVFGDRPLTAEEVFALRAAMNAANQGKLAKQHATQPISVILIALVLAALVLILLNAAWSKRQRGIRSVLVARKEPQS